LEAVIYSVTVRFLSEYPFFLLLVLEDFKAMKKERGKLRPVKMC
jgi:hypothetical protein